MQLKRTVCPHQEAPILRHMPPNNKIISSQYWDQISETNMKDETFQHQTIDKDQKIKIVKRKMSSNLIYILPKVSKAKPRTGRYVQWLIVPSGFFKKMKK